MKNTILITVKQVAVSAAVFTVLFGTLALPEFVSANQYGGQEPVTKLSIDKKVGNPAKGEFVDNLSIGDNRFKAGDEVKYKIDITNNGNQSFTFVDVKDTLPDFLEFVAGPGTYNASTRELTYRVENFTPGKVESREIKTRIISNDKLPNGNSIFCIVNRATAVPNKGDSVSDKAEICAERTTTKQPVTEPGKKPSTIKELPSTGVGMYTLAAAFTGAMGVGFALRKAHY